MNGANSLSAEEARRALRIVAKKWLDSDGAEAYVVVRGASKKAEIEKMKVPAFLAQRALTMLLASGNRKVVRWTKEAISTVEGSKSKSVAQVLDPVSLAIIGGTVIGAILAARVRKIGAVEFYEGVSEELAKVLKAGESILRTTIQLGPGAGGG